MTMAHAITPTATPKVAPLTRTDQVAAVLAAGGRAVVRREDNIWELYDRDGRNVPAWQNAIKAAVKLHYGEDASG